MHVDYIIVGLGLAGLAFTKELEEANKSFVVYEDNSQNSSIVAGGMYNPVILKRFTPVWNAIEQLKVALPFYQSLEYKFGKKYDFTIPIYRIFKSVEEQNNWFIASDNPLLANYMDADLIHKKFEGIIADFGFGKLINTGRVDTKLLLQDYRNYLSEKQLIRNQGFDYSELNISETQLNYKGVKASNIVFCEGFGLKKNPYFNYLPMQEAKGELITILAPNLAIDFALKAAVFVLPLGNDYYRVGATFNWKDKTKQPSAEGKKELLDKLNSFIEVPYKIVDHSAGIRPTVKDRRPLVGVHPKYKNISVLNGLGTRGVMIAPIAAKALYNHLEKNITLDNEISIARFQHLFLG
ncbi:MAG: FAD-binding oxidoreductase [Lutibacter sp.]|uniref:NAD(P)/FAD-dependent oxidoreductase n=1 Tax=Lutibacter sp. TaxID=1925666 RepID=UPI0017D9703F|nr:FAD-binding oxidoreductase [Lutibacter sp.]MBT8316819.1 FAD-binding oxidoreductase [Lutibacter sp.]NNJ57679.1 FAD-binding oxidoreductase [Lutibacter sp.]